MRSLILLFVLTAGSAWADPTPIKATQDGNNLIMESPYGRKIFFGDLGFAANLDYLVSIPVAALKTAPSTGSSADSSNLNFKEEADKLIQSANAAFLGMDYKSSLAAVDRVLEMDPGNVRAWMMKGSLMHVMGDKEMALKAWGKAHEFDPANKDIARILEKAGK